jgi:Ca2+-binding RTX toxin-like protein
MHALRGLHHAKGQPMSTFTGTNADETITPEEVSSTVTTNGQPRPSADIDTIDAGGGNDVVAGGGGNDVALLGSGDDTFIWNPGDGSDTVDGQAGFDTLAFVGSSADEKFDIAANGQHVRLFRDVGNVTMDLNGVERINLAASGGTDTITVNDLSGTDAKIVAIDLSRDRGNGGDRQVDTVSVQGTAGPDAVVISGFGNNVVVSGLAAQTTIDHADKADQLVVNAGAGNDTIDASNLGKGHIGLQLFGGDGDDSITGSDGDDFVNGGRGNDVARLGGGDDTFVWNPGDGSDTVEGQGGFDTLVFNGANISEKVDITADGSRVLFTRDVATITMDLNGIEQIKFAALGGSDNINVGNLAGTDVQQVAIDLGSTGGVGDGAADTVTVSGTASNDHIKIAGGGDQVTVNGLPAQVTIDHVETLDKLVVQGGAGDDIIDASGTPAGGMQFILDGGEGNDVLHGGQGSDLLTGGAGADRFEFSGFNGTDTIADFQQGLDKIDFLGYGGALNKFGDLAGHISQIGADTHINLGGVVAGAGSIILQNTQMGSLSSSDFAFK